MSNPGGADRLPDDEPFPIASTLGQAIQSGLPLETALRALAEQTRQRKTRQALMNFSEQLEQGTPLTEALQTYGRRLPRSMRVLLKAGIESGHLDSIMRYCIDQQQRATSLRRDVLIAFSYPAFVIWFSAVICGGILAVGVPQFKKIFDDFGTEMPVLTMAFITLSDVILNFSRTSLLIMAVIGLALIVKLFVVGSTRWGQAFLMCFPGFNQLFRYASLTDFCQMLASLTEAGLPLTKAIQFAGEGSDDRHLRRQSLCMIREIDEGVTPYDAAHVTGLPNALCQVFRESTSPPTLASALRGLSEVFAARCQVVSLLANVTITHFMVIFVLAFAGLTVLSLFMPLIKLLNDLA